MRVALDKVAPVLIAIAAALSWNAHDYVPAVLFTLSTMFFLIDT